MLFVVNKHRADGLGRENRFTTKDTKSTKGCGWGPDPERVKRILDAALEREEAARANFVRDECGDDAALLKEVESLLIGRMSSNVNTGLRSSI